MDKVDGMQTFSVSGPPPIPGKAIDPSPEKILSKVEKADSKGKTVGTMFRALMRFTYAESPLLAAGTAYYAFLAVLAIVVAAFGIAALVGGETLINAITASLSKAFPGLVGDNGLSPSQLQSVGTTTSIVGLVLLLFSGAGAMIALSRTIHIIFGAPKDGRKYMIMRLRLLAWMLVLVPLMALSFIPAVAITDFAKPILTSMGVQSGVVSALLLVITEVVSLGLNFLVIWLIFSHLGGIRPSRHARLVGCIFGAIGIEILKYLLSAIIGWSMSKPQYGAFAAPIAMMFVLFLESLVLCLAACFTAATAEGEPDLSGDLPSTAKAA